MRLNPHFPGWYRLATVFNAYRTRDYRAAVDAALRIQMPGYFWTSVTCAAAFGQLGESEAAQKALRELLVIRPNFATTARTELEKWFHPDLAEHFLEGLRKAGLEAAAADSAVRVPSPATETTRTTSGATRGDEGFWVAVLPFKYTGTNADLTTLAEGLTDDVITGMSKFSYLRVIARSSTARYAREEADVRTAAKELGARYVMEGSIRQAGAKIRIVVQLVDAVSGAGLWAETYDRAFTAEAMLDLLDDVVPRIVSTVGDAQGVLPHSMTDALRNRDPQSLTPYEAVLRSFGYHQLVSAAEHLAGITALEHAVKQAPERADCWAMLSWLYRGEYTHGFNARPDPLGRALAAARRAIDAEPSNQIAHAALASVFFCQRDFVAFRSAAQRALVLNRMEGYATAYLGLQLAFSGDWEQGCALAEKATQLNPNHPGWYWFPLAYDAYRQGDGQRALEYALKVNLPGLWTAQLSLTVIYSQLGQMEQARAALRGLLAVRPNFTATPREDLEKWWQPEMVEQILGDLRKVGIEEASQKVERRQPTSTGARAANNPSGETRTEEGFWVAVLPFKYNGGNADLTALAEGLSEEVITGLSRFSYLRVIARGSTLSYANQTTDLRTVGRELGARYVMEGNLRQAGTKLRLAVQLVDATSGAHLWAENYERAFSPETVFELQDDLVPRIVSTVADWYGVLPHSMSEALRSKGPDQLSPYEAVLRSFGYYERVTAEEHAAARFALERAVQQAPGNSDGWAMLSMIYGEEFRFGFNVVPDSLGRSLEAARRAADAAPTNHRAYLALAQALFFRKEFDAFRNEAEQAIALNRMDGSTLEYLGHLIAFSGDWEHGCEVAEQARQWNPHHPPWYWAVPALDAYRRGDYRSARTFALKAAVARNFLTHAILAAIHGQLGEHRAAVNALRELREYKPDFVETGRGELSKWYPPDLVEHLIEGLRKAGLEIAGDSSASASQPAGTTSGANRADEGFWVAVLPFKYVGSNTELAALADGLTDDIVTGFSKFSYLRVLARSSTARYARETVDVRTAAKDLGARYVMEGSLRQAGSKVRIAAHLIDATTGASLWAETYDRAFDPSTMLDVVDDVVPRIVSTVGDTQGILPHSMTEVLRDREPEQLSPYEALVRSFGHLKRVNMGEHAAARAALEHAVKHPPERADCWALLSILYREEYTHNINLRPDPLGRALAAARRAVELGPTNHLGYGALASTLYFRRDLVGFHAAAERALALNPTDGGIVAYLGMQMAYGGEWDRGCALCKRAIELNSNHPGWYWFPMALNTYRLGDYRETLNIVARINMPNFWRTHLALAVAYGQLGDHEAARSAVQELLRIRPDFPTGARDELKKWYDPKVMEHIIDGLRKAGFEVQ